MALKQLAVLSSLRNQSYKGYHFTATNWQHKMAQPPLPRLSKHFKLLSADQYVNKQVSRFSPETRPLVIILTWLSAKKRHVDKYSEIYLKRDYDVLTVTIEGWELLLPSRGSQIVAQDLLNYLHQFSIRGKQPLLLHGFSVGAYFWGEVLLKVNSDLSKYSEVMQRVKGIIWDSTPDFKDTLIGLPIAIAPNNLPLRLLIRSYVAMHLLLFYPLSTRHHIASSRALHKTPCRAPILILICKNDPIASVESNLNVKKSWESLGIETTIKIWDHSKHVSHYVLYPEEYLDEIQKFLKKINFPMNNLEQKEIQSKL